MVGGWFEREREGELKKYVFIFSICVEKNALTPLEL